MALYKIVFSILVKAVKVAQGVLVVQEEWADKEV